MNKILPYILLIAAIILISVGVAEQMYIEKISNNMLMEIEEAEKLFHEERIEESSYKIENIMASWKESENVMYMMLNHKDVHKISEVLIEIDSKLKNFFISDNISTNFAILKLYINDIKVENKFEVSNIL